MATPCPKCQSDLPLGANFCPQCGAATKVASEPSFSLPTTTHLSARSVSFLCYLCTFVTGAIFLNLNPYRHDPTIRFHAWQSIFFGAAWLAISLFKGSLPWIFIPLFPISLMIQLLFFVLWILLMIRAYQGERFKLPVLGDLAEARG